MRIGIQVLEPREYSEAAAILGDDVCFRNGVWDSQRLTQERLTRSLEEEVRRGRHQFFGVRDGDRLIGVMNLYQMDVERRRAIAGIAMHPDYRGGATPKTTSAIKIARMALADIAFGQLNLNRLYGSILETNRASIALCLAVGAKIEGRIPRDRFVGGRFVGTVCVGLLADDFRAPSQDRQDVTRADLGGGR